MAKPLGRLERVSPREAWRHEASQFTPWLAEEENLNLLADALGLGELSLVHMEHWVGDFKLDLLCTDGTDQVLIENQLDRTNHSHLGQILTYAAGIDARKVVWIAESFRPEHVAAFEFLNQHTTEELKFFAVQIELYRIGDSPVAPKFSVLVKPNEWAKAGREQARVAATSTPTKQRHLAFWQRLVEVIGQRSTTLRPQAPLPQHWLNISIGRSGFGLLPTLNNRIARLGVEVSLNSPDAKQQFQALLARRDEIESALGFGLDWQEMPDKISSRIATWRDDSPPADEARWNEYLEWMADRVVRMDAVFRPLIRQLP